MSSCGRPPSNAPSGEAPRASPPRRIALDDILEGAREAIIIHDGQDYRLRLTANGKLILTK